MRLALVLTILFLCGCATATPPTPPLNDPNAYQVQPGPVGEQYLEEPNLEESTPAPLPARPQSQATSPAQTLARGNQPQAGQQKIPKGWTKERMAEADELNALGKRWRQQYIAAKRPVFRLKFRHEYPSMSDEEIEVLVNDAVEEGLQEAMQKDRERLFGGPVTSPPVRPPISCTSYQLGIFTNTDCY